MLAPARLRCMGLSSIEGTREARGAGLVGIPHVVVDMGETTGCGGGG